MTESKAVNKLQKDIQTQGYGVIKGSKWYFTTGFGLKDKPDLIAPATFPFSVFQTIVSKYASGELHDLGKFFLSEFMINTESMGKEPSRYEIRSIDDKDSVTFNEQLTSGLMVCDFKKFSIVQGPDDDNRLYGETDCRFEKSSEALLLDLIFLMHEENNLKIAKQKEDREHAEKVLSKTPTPRNKRNKSNKKKNRR